MELVNALTLEGELEKESATLIKFFQTRYFAIRIKGECLVWYKKKPLTPDIKPQGSIFIHEIISCKADGSNETVFKINYKERKFVLRAESEELRDQWVAGLNILIEHQKKLNKNRQNVQKGPESWRWNNDTNKELGEQIRVETEEMIFQESEGNKRHKSDVMLGQFTHNATIFDLDKCTIHGFHTKKGILQSNERWFLLISPYSLADENEEDQFKGSHQLIDIMNTEKRKSQKEAKKIQSSESDSQQEQEPSQKYTHHIIYEFDPKTKVRKHFYKIESIMSWQVKENEQPVEMKIKYEELVNQEEQQWEEKEVILQNQYLTEIKKWEKALRIIYQKESIAQIRDEQMNNRSKKYFAKRWRFADEEKWTGPEENKFITILLSRTSLRITQHKFLLEELDEPKKQSIQEGDEKINVLQLSTKNKKIYIIFQNEQTQKKFTKKIHQWRKKVKKNDENKSPLKFQQTIDHERYYIKKKIKESQSEIKVNFYELMGRQPPKQKTQLFEQKEENSWWDKMMSFFCSRPPQHS